LREWAATSQRGDAIDRAISKARALLPVDRNEWDVHGHLLCVGNGVVDLKTGELMPHNRSFKMRLKTDVPYYPDAKAPTWERALKETQPSADVRNFLCQSVGYSATASIAEQVYFLNYGTGGIGKNGQNGKSTFIDTIAAVLGGYSASLPIETFLYSPLHNTGTTPGLAKLPSKRFVVMSEPEAAARLAEGFIKRVTGDEKVMVNPKYQKAFDLKIEFKLWFSANYLPKITGTDDGIWRRQIPIPWPVQIPEQDRDLHLKERLWAEASGILAWIVRGAMQWFDQGRLIRPTEIVEAAKGERQRQDVVGSFIRDCCDVAPELYDEARVLYASYKEWTEGSADAITQTRFGRELEGRGYAKERCALLGGRVIRNGLKVKAEHRARG